ncbi:MAG: hypothetical protein C6P37_10775 [Caldibacillus debilis]|uniref:Uncharacterized protein n=1 Tax=Caldibacillus debilis TaxID=301148 RepID=A0A3E0K2Z2_9BACI|nr:MAG: hypothetical protein C6P37_10775 [Caldibacillus debilis]
MACMKGSSGCFCLQSSPFFYLRKDGERRAEKLFRCVASTGKRKGAPMGGESEWHLAEPRLKERPPGRAADE